MFEKCENISTSIVVENLLGWMASSSSIIILPFFFIFEPKARSAKLLFLKTSSFFVSFIHKQYRNIRPLNSLVNSNNLVLIVL